MSQHRLRTLRNGEPVEVLLGWDRRLRCFFMVVETCAQQEGGDDEHLYDNLHEADPFTKDLPYFRAKLAELGIAAPESLFVEVQRDAEHNAGNRRVEHQPDGSFRALDAN
jgi:hypothetical protein